MKTLVLVMGFLLCGFHVSAEETEESTPFVYDDKGKRDPFTALVTSTGVFLNVEKEYLLSDLALEGTMIGKSGNIAIINGQIVREKQAIGDFIVEKIDNNTVTLLKGDKRSVLRLTKEE